MTKLNPHFNISASFIEYNRITGKAMVTVDYGVYITLEPKEKSTTINDITTVEKYLKCCYVDETAGYSHEFLLARDDLNQLTTLLSTLKGQLAVDTKDNTNGQTSCSRGIVIK